VRAVRLRYINRLKLPMPDDQNLNLDDYLKIGPRSPDENILQLTGFTTQVSAIETETAELANVVLVAEAGTKDFLPVILDIAVARDIAATRDVAAPKNIGITKDAVATFEMGDWESMRSTIASLRRLKNRIFVNMLTSKCIELYL
jgi:hypothetical protein